MRQLAFAMIQCMVAHVLLTSAFTRVNNKQPFRWQLSIGIIALLNAFFWAAVIPVSD